MRTVASCGFFAGAGILALAGGANAQLIAYEGFQYPPAASVTGQTGGNGFSTPWQSAGYGDWHGDPVGLDALTDGLMLVRKLGAASSSYGGLQRSLSTPISGAQGTTTWIRVLVKHQGPTADSWLGVKLPCSGPGSEPFLFIGKPFGRDSWGVDNGQPGGVQTCAIHVYQKVSLVAKLENVNGACDVTLWTDPSLAGEPSAATAALHLTGYGHFTDMRKVLIETGGTGVQNELDEIRIGGTYADVSPVEPGVVLDGYLASPVGGAAVATSADGRKWTVSNIGSSGQDGVEIKLRTLFGGGVKFESTPTPNAPGSMCRQKYKGWDGLIKSTRTSVTNADGTLTNTYDYTPLGATSLHVAQYDGSGHLVTEQTFAGGLAVTPLMPAPCPAGSQFPYKTWYDIWVDGKHYLGFYCNDPINPIGIVVVTPTFPPGTNPDMRVQSCIVEASGMAELDISEPGISMREGTLSSVSELPPLKPLVRAMGDGVCYEHCDSGDCTDPALRKWTVSNIGSSGQDGVEIDWPNGRPSTSGNVDLGDMFNTPRDGLMIMRYMFGLRGAALRVSSSGNGHVTVSPDFSPVGSTQYMVTAYVNDQVVHQSVHANLDPIDLGTDQVICGPGSTLVWGWVTQWYWTNWPISGYWQTYWGVVGCQTIGTGGGNPTYTDRVIFRPVNPLPQPDIAGMEITGTNLDRISVLGVESSDVIPCTADYNGDGFLDFFDLDSFIACFEGTECPPDRSADFDGDGFIDFFDVDGFVNAFETGC